MILQLTFSCHIPPVQLCSLAALPEHTQSCKPQRLGRKLVPGAYGNRGHLTVRVLLLSCVFIVFFFLHVWHCEETIRPARGRSGSTTLSQTVDPWLTSGLIKGFSNIMSESWRGGGNITGTNSYDSTWIKRKRMVRFSAHAIAPLTVSGCLILASFLADSLLLKNMSWRPEMGSRLPSEFKKTTSGYVLQLLRFSRAFLRWTHTS